MARIVGRFLELVWTADNIEDYGRHSIMMTAVPAVATSYPDLKLIHRQAHTPLALHHFRNFPIFTGVPSMQTQ